MCVYETFQSINLNGRQKCNFSVSDRSFPVPKSMGVCMYVCDNNHFAISHTGLFIYMHLFAFQMLSLQAAAQRSLSASVRVIILQCYPQNNAVNLF